MDIPKNKEALNIIIATSVKWGILRKWEHRGNYKKVEDKLEEILYNYQRILKEFHNNKLADEAQMGIGSYYVNLKKYDNAIREFRKVIERYPQSNSVPFAMYAIGGCYKSLKDYKKAIKKYKIVIEKYPDSLVSPDAQNSIATIYQYYLKNYQQAIKEYQKVINNYPNYDNIRSVKRGIERCRLILKLQQKGLNSIEYENKSIDELKKILKMHK
jgi:tetratricopeptide (TPR) repeat protein